MADSDATTAAAILSRALEVQGDGMPVEGARFLLSLGINDVDKRRALDLFAKRQASTLTADNVLSILRAQAILALKRAGQGPDLTPPAGGCRPSPSPAG